MDLSTSPAGSRRGDHQVEVWIVDLSVASDVGGIPESVVDSQTGLLVPLGNGDALCAALASLIVNPALRKRLGDAGRRRYLQHFTLEEMVARTIQVYTDVVAERAAPSNDVAFKQKTRLSRDSYGPVHEPGRK
ncbi:MAG: glycosyltransferase [Acidobacteriaceae bacterium]|nr:glycosyltransferase [Acidobacteriaceae bacterium]